MLHHIGIVAGNDHRTHGGDNRVLETVRVITGRTPHLIGSLKIEEWECWCHMYNFGIGSPRFEIVIPWGGKLLEWAKEHPMNSLHHIALRVNNIRQRSKYCADRGLPILSAEPVKGVCNTLVNFLHPSYCGVMIELVEDLPNV